MANASIKAPANVKISGEHSVVYGGPSLSAAIEIYATADVKELGGDKLTINLTDLKAEATFGESELKEMYKKYSSRDTSTPAGLQKFITDHNKISSSILPYATIAARLYVQYGVSPFGKQITIHSDVPIQKGYASSAVCSTAFAMALLKSSGKSLDDQTAIDVIRDGERIVHKVETAGRMDVGPAYFGGYAIVSASEGIKSAGITTKMDVVVFDTGSKPPTSEMVKKVRELRERDTAGTDKTLREIDACVVKCIDSLKNGDIRALGHQMSINHELLRRLGVSSEGLDRAVSIAVSNGAYGAKLCGGGGGGIGIAVTGSASEAKKVIDALNSSGFDAYMVKISLNGARQ